MRTFHAARLAMHTVGRAQDEPVAFEPVDLGGAEELARVAPVLSTATDTLPCVRESNMGRLLLAMRGS